MNEPLPPWTLDLWRRLQAARAQGRLGQALLLTGPRGVGKRPFARALAQSLLCRDNAAQGLACGRCVDCHLLAAGNHPDLIAIGPDPEGRSDEIAIDRVRWLIERESLTPSRADCQVIWIDPADRLNHSAANALLKTLEEPSGQSHFLLIAEDPSRLPATIRSRCVRLLIPIPPEEKALAWLNRQDPRQDWPLYLQLAQGAPLRAKALAGDTAWQAQRQECLRCFIELISGLADPLSVAQSWQLSGAGLILEWLAGAVADLLRLRVCKAPPRLSHPDQVNDLRAVAARTDPLAGHRWLQQILKSRPLLAANNLNQQLMLESLAIQGYGIARGAGGLDL